VKLKDNMFDLPIANDGDINDNNNGKWQQAKQRWGCGAWSSSRGYSRLLVLHDDSH